jgi:hypothetical protein
VAGARQLNDVGPDQGIPVATALLIERRSARHCTRDELLVWDRGPSQDCDAELGVEPLGEVPAVVERHVLDCDRREAEQPPRPSQTFNRPPRLLHCTAVVGDGFLEHRRRDVHVEPRGVEHVPQQLICQASAEKIARELRGIEDDRLHLTIL